MTQEFAFVFVDIDGYCVSGIDQRKVVAPGAEGFRARELGWACYARGHHMAGSIYFHDEGLDPIPEYDKAVLYTRKLHGLPVSPKTGAYGAEIVVPASCLLDTLAALHDAINNLVGLPVLFVHKGGHEGHWARKACPGVTAVDLTQFLCPPASKLWGEHAGPWLRGCAHHDMRKVKKKDMVHCPQLEIAVLVQWVAQAQDVQAL